MQNSTLFPILSKATPGGWLWFLRIGVSVLCLMLIGFKLSQQPFPPHFLDLVSGTWPAYLLCAALVLPNLGLEAYKWHYGCRQIYAITFRHAMRATLRGISLGFPLTSAVGDYAGKLMGLPRRRSPVLVPVMTLHSFSQYMVSFLGGVLGLWLWYSFLPQMVPLQAVITISVLGGMLISAYLFFVPISRYLSRHLSRIVVIRLRFREVNRLKIPFLIMAAARYGVFLLQYLLLLKAVAPQAAIVTLIAGVAVLLAIKTVVPLLSFAGFVGLRELVAMALFAPLGLEAWQVVTAGLSLWVINQAAPGLLGSLLLIKPSRT